VSRPQNPGIMLDDGARPGDSRSVLAKAEG
jgi:hypothetical protein